MKTLVINNDGGGFSDYVEVPEATAVSELVQQKIGSRSPSHYLIRVNASLVSPNNECKLIAMLR